MKITTAVLFLLLVSNQARADDELKLIITSNLKGNFSTAIDDQEKKDQLILLGQSIITERKAGDGLYIDLGNSFYPGIIAKYSYGSAMMDFFRYFDCVLTLISSADIRIGINSLEFLQKGNPTQLMSGNLMRKDSYIFKPYFIHTVKNRKIAFVALSSKDILVDVAEKNIFQAGIEDEKASLAKILEKLKKEQVSNIILLSGLNDETNFEILREFREIDLVLSGADNSAGILNKRINRVELHDRRNIIGASQSNGYYLLQLGLADKIKVLDYRFHPSRYHGIDSKRYSEFIERLTRWKDHFRSNTGDVLANIRGGSFVLNDDKIAFLLRDRFNAEISLLRKDSLTPLKIDERIKQSDIIFSINDSYSIFTYKLTGSEINFIIPYLENVAISGLVKGKVQGYDIQPDRFYRIVSTQSAFDDVQAILKRETPVLNTWMNINELVAEDIKGRKILFFSDYGYLDRRFRATADVALSNYFNRTTVDFNKSDKTPTGKPDKSFKQWGIEDKIDFTLYNNIHQFVITPYIYYEKQENEYLHNLMRGTLLYSLNMDYFIKAYHKSQAETVVREVHDQKPAVIRETVGANIDGAIIKGKLGIGFEKEVRDPVNVPVYGLEAILNAEYKFMNYFAYKFSLDSFFAYSTVTNVTAQKGQRRIEMENAVSFKMTEIVSLALKHKWFRYYYIKHNDKYTDSQVVASLDMKTNFKIY